MIVLGHGAGKFSEGRLIKSSSGAGWPNLLAELRSHSASVLPSYVPTANEIAIIVKGRAKVTRRADHILQQSIGTPGMIWLCPAGLQEEFVEIASPLPKTLHLYLPPKPFAMLADTGIVKTAGTASLRYASGFNDGLIREMARAVLTEMEAETSSGKILIEALTSSLAACLLQRYSETALRLRRPSASTRGLDPRRLGRVVDYIESNLDGEVSLAGMAAVACFSQFHFARAFKIATGTTPHQYVSRKRLDLAKSLIEKGEQSLADIAFTCGFSSQSSFSRAFRRAVGLNPGRFRTDLVSEPTGGAGA